MKDEETRKKFIELRAQGLSFDKIRKEINVSKPTLIKWARKYRKEIAQEEHRLDREREKKYKAWVKDYIQKRSEMIQETLKPKSLPKL